MMPKFIVRSAIFYPQLLYYFRIPERCLTAFVLGTALFSSQTKYGDTFFFYHGSVSPYFKQVLNEYCAVPAQLLHQVSPYRLIHLVNQLL